MNGNKNEEHQPTSFKERFVVLLQLYASYVLTFLTCVLLLRVYEMCANHIDSNIKSHFASFVGTLLVNDLLFVFIVSGYLLVITGIFYFISQKAFYVLLVILCSVIVLVHLMLVQYFSVVLNLLGADAFQYSWAEIKQTLGVAVSKNLVFLLVSNIIAIVLAFVYLPRYIKVGKKLGLVIAVLCLFGLFAGFSNSSFSARFGSEYNNNLVQNKSAYFYKAALQTISKQPDADVIDEMSNMFGDQLIGKPDNSNNTIANDFVYKDEANFPFLHTDSTKDVLSAFMKRSATPPNFVFIIVEGLGRAFSNDNAYLGSFTPFLDSLSTHSLYWENCISTAGRTFEVLPSVLGSLPYSQHGFTELGGQMPRYLGLISVLGANGYHSSFYYAGDSKFDNMNLFVKRQGINFIGDVSTFGPSYKKLPANAEGFTWGYGDFELFRKYLEEESRFPAGKPQVSVLLTVSTHSPFKVNDQTKYDALFEKRIRELKLDTTSIGQHREYKPQYASVLFMDDAIRHFIGAYKSRPSFQNTVFIITGDHRMPDIPMSTKIDRYHIPLIIYSPMLMRTARFQAVVSHLDITPSLLAFEKKTYHLKTPTLVTWMGAGLDTTRFFRNVSNYPLIPTKQGVSEYLSGIYMLSGNDLFQLSLGMGLDPFPDETKKQKLMQLLRKFQNRNNKMGTNKTLIPDSLFKRYGKM